MNNEQREEWINGLYETVEAEASEGRTPAEIASRLKGMYPTTLDADTAAWIDRLAEQMVSMYGPAVTVNVTVNNYHTTNTITDSPGATINNAPATQKRKRTTKRKRPQPHSTSA